ncbi:MAG: tetratricopeptide repeat protein [Flavobacteriales bacterium]|nr:tetratricopeptide repeat protein [Flavobacteriales bacterium]
MQLKAGNAEDAHATFSQDLVYWPENGYALQGLHDALLAQGRKTEAEEVNARIAQAWSLRMPPAQ